MHFQINLSRLAVAATLFLVFTGGCASSSGPVTQPPKTEYMKSAVGTSNEMSPLAPGDAKNVRKVGNNWLCDVNGKTMIYDNAAACWQAQQK
jgi:hypothetical protein